MSRAEEIVQRIERVASSGFRQAYVATVYAEAIDAIPSPDPLWSRINAAITARWPKGLDRVKKLAWEAHRVR